MTDNRPLPLTGEDWFRHTATRIDRLERRTGNMLTPDLLGPGIASMAVGIIDWNALEVTFNGFFYSNPGLAINSPDPEVPWTGQTIAKDDGSGMQQVWSVDTLEPIYWVRNYAPNPEPGGQPVFGPWQRFASSDGSIPDSVIRTQWEDADAYTLTADDVADGAFVFTLTYIPILESVQAAWGGVIQQPTEYYMNFATAQVLWTLQGFEAEGDVFWFHYTHDRVLSPAAPPEEPCTPLTGLVLRGAVWAGNLATEIALPIGTQIGDLIVVTGHGNNDGGKNFPLGAGAMSDPRMTGYYGHPSGDDWWGTATDLSPVQIAIPALIGSGANAFAQVSTYGDSGESVPLTVGTPVSVTKAEVYANGGEPVDVVALNSRAVVALCTYDHGSGSDTPDVPTGYTPSDSSYSSHASTAAYWTGDPNSPSSTWTVISAYQRYDRTVTLLPVMVEDCAEPLPEPEPAHIYDTFERAALLPGAFDEVSGDNIPWVLTAENVPAPHEGFQIVSGVLYPVANSAGEFLTIDGGVPDGTFTVDRFGGSLTNPQDDRIAFRVSDDGTTGFFWHLDGVVAYFDVNVHVTTSGTPGIYNGGGEVLASGVGDDLDVFEGEMKIVLDGDTMTFYQDDVEVGEVIDSRNNTATRFGFGTSDATPGLRGYARIDFYAASIPPPDPSGPGPYETPLSSKAVQENYGICQHVNFQTDNIHTWQAEILERYGSMHVKQMRSLYVPNTSAAFTAAIDGCRAHGIRWNATVATRQESGAISPSEATIRTRIQKMASDHADVIGYIEGVNEPNHEEDPDWVANSLRAQWVIWDEWSQHPELAHVKVLSPSMHDTRLDASDGAHWDEWANGEVTGDDDITYTGKDLCHMAAVHNYPGGSLPDTKRDERVQWVYDAFGEGWPVKLTEWGYTTTLGEPRIGGHKVTNEAAAAAYAAQGILDHAKAGFEVLQYEMMDDPNSGNNDTEKNFGQWKVSSFTGTPDTTWTAKPSVAAITAVLSALADPGVGYIPHDVTLDLSDVPSGVRTLVTQKRNGDTTLWLWRHEEMWDPIDETPITVGTVSVPVTDVVGLRNITVGVMPVAVEVREA